MPRVQGLDTTQRRRHGGGPQPPSSSSTGTGGIFSLSTPFSNFAGRASTTVAPKSTGTANRTNNNDNNPSSSSAAMTAEDDLSFHETQQSMLEEEEVPGTQNPNFPTMTSSRIMAPHSRATVIPTASQTGGGGDNPPHAASNNTNTNSQLQHFQQMQRQFAMTVYQQQQQAQKVNNNGLPSVRQGNTIIGGSGGRIATEITPRDKPRPLNGMDLKRSSSSSRSYSSFCSNNIRGECDATSSSNTDTNLDASCQGDGRMIINRQCPPPAVGGASGDATATSSFTTKTTAALAATAMTSSSAGSPSSGVEATTKQIPSSNTKTESSTAGAHSSNTTFESVAQKNPTIATTATTSTTVAMSNDHGEKEVAIVPNSNQEEDVTNDDKNKLVFQDGMDDDDDDSESNNASDDDDEEQSVDLLNGNNGNNNDVLPTRNNNNAFSPSPISPATQTLDRLSMIGSQDGGAELCVHLSANAVGTPMREEKVDVSRSNSAEEETTATTIISTKKDHGRRDSALPSISKTKAPQNSRITPSTQQQGKGSSTTTLTKQQCIRSLKAYFMSTQNSAVYAQNKLNSSNGGGMELPLVTFCHNCNNNNNNALLSQVPHHSLCPKHEDFFVSGSYEILNLIVDGNILGCTACMHHFRNGRPNKQLVHLENCKRYKKAKDGRVGKKGQKAAACSSGSAGGMGLTQSSTNTGPKQGTAGKARAGQGDQTQKQRSVNNNADSRGSDGSQDSPELSDYEKLRLRNIQRNEARLAALGLLVPSNKKTSVTKKSSKEGFLSRSDSDKNDGPKKMKSKRKKEPEVQKRTQPKRHKQKIGEEVPSQSSRPAPASTNKENSGISNQKQRRANDVRNDDEVTVAKGKSIESRSSLMEAAKSGCRKCTLEWQTNTKDPTKHHDSCCPRTNSSRLVNTQQQLNLNASKNSSRTPLPPNSSPIVEKKKAAKVIPRPLPPIQEARHTCAPPTMTMADTSTNIGQTEQSIVIDVDSNLFNYALQKGFSAAFLRGKTEEELLGLLSNSRDSQQSVETILPPFIRDFIAEADRNNEIPAPRGTKWLSCPNPWGKIGHEEGDFVVISPFQSESTADMVSIFHQCSNGNIPKRFVANPLKEGSQYHDTHRSPARKGYSVLRLTRDRMGLRPWGFTVRLHEFGGACLVDSIEPLSPAEAAEDISGWTDKGAPVGLQLHDMIICVNGKSVGCMTEAELQLDLELCGSEMMLVVARFDIEGNTNQDVTLADLAMEWNDIGAGAHPRKKTVCFEDEESSENRYDLDLIPKNTSIQVQDRPDSESHDDGNNRPERESHVDDNDDSANEEENENENDGLDGAEDASSFDWVPRRTSELESKSDEVLMRQLINTVESGNWDRHKGSQMANLLARRGFLAAANDERFQRFCCNSGGVTKEQALEWMSRSEIFQQYEQTVRAKWSESTFQNHTWDALKDVGYTKISGGGSGVLARYALPEDILSRELQLPNVKSQNYQSDDEATSDEEDSDIRKQGRTNLDIFVSELESKSDEELMQQLIDTAESGNWNKVKDPQLAKLLAKRAFLAAAKDETFQKLSCSSGGVTKEQVFEWMSRSATFQQYEQIMRAKWSESTFQNRTWDALKDVGYTKISGGGSGVLARYALPEDILSRELQLPNVTSRNYQSDDDSTSDAEDSDNRKQGRRKVDIFESELESKSDEELMQQLIDTVESGDWKYEISPLAKLLMKRAFLAAAKDERFQRLSCSSGGVTKDQPFEWMSRSETFHQYERIVRAKWSESSFQTYAGSALKDAGYTIVRGHRSVARYLLPEDILSRELQRKNVPRVGNNVVPNASKQKAIENAGSNAGKRKRSDTFAKRKKQFNLYFDDSQSGLEEESENEEEEEEDDDNPWLGCVCGRTHPPPIQVFWIQCGACDAWHNVAEDCVGFREEVADTIDDWHCWSCNPPCAGLNL